MSAEIPPTDYFNGMTFNKSFYQSSTDDYLTASTGKKLFLSYPISQGSEIFSSNITLQSTLTDSSGDVGLSGQVLSSTGTATNWTYNSTNGYLALDLSSLPYTLALSSANTYIYVTGGTVSGGILTIPTSGIPNSSYLVIRNNSLFSFNISTSIMTFTQGAILSTISVAAVSTIALFYNGTFWIQSAISDTVNTFYTGTIYSSYVATDNLSQSATHTEVNMFSDTTVGDIFLGKTLPSPQTVRICNTSSGSSGGSVHLCNVGFDAFNINNATTKTTGNLRLGNDQTTGTLYIGGGSTTAARTSGPIIIGSDSTMTGGINIGTGTSLTVPTASTVNIGSGTITTIIKGALTISKPITMPATYTAPTISQLGWTDFVSNTSATSITVGTTLTDILSTGSVLPLGSLLITFYLTATFSVASATMTFRFTEGTGVNVIGKPANDRIFLSGSSSVGVNSSFLYTIPVTCTNTSNAGDIFFKGLVSSGTGTITQNSCKMSWIKIS